MPVTSFARMLRDCSAPLIFFASGKSSTARRAGSTDASSSCEPRSVSCTDSGSNAATATSSFGLFTDTGAGNVRSCRVETTFMCTAARIAPETSSDTTIKSPFGPRKRRQSAAGPAGIQNVVFAMAMRPP